MAKAAKPKAKESATDEKRIDEIRRLRKGGEMQNAAVLTATLGDEDREAVLNEFPDLRAPVTRILKRAA